MFPSSWLNIQGAVDGFMSVFTCDGAVGHERQAFILEGELVEGREVCAPMVSFPLAIAPPLVVPGSQGNVTLTLEAMAHVPSVRAIERYLELLITWQVLGPADVKAGVQAFKMA